MTQLPQKLNQHNLALPAAMAEKLDVVRSRSLRVQIGTALVVAVGVLLSAMAVAMLVDWLATIYDFRWRALLTYSAWTAAGATLIAWALAAWKNTRQVDRVAVKVDQHIPELEERWSTVTELSTNGHSRDVHPAMFEQVSREAQGWNPRVEADRVVPLDGLIRALLFLTAITTVLGLAVVFNSHQTTVLLQRFWQPFTPISATELADLPGDLVVGRGESLEIEASLVGAPVAEASLLLQPPAGDAETITLTPRTEEDSQARVSHRLRSVKQPLRYRLRAGDGQTDWYEIVVADRPKLGKVELTLTPPAYTGQAPEVINKLPRRMTVLEGSRVELAIQPKQPLRSMQLKFDANLAEPLTADAKGWYRWETTLTESLTFQPLMTEEHGLDNLRPPTCEIRCRPDRPPVVKILTPSSELAVRPDETVPVTFIATDDVGVQQAELVVYDESDRQGGKPRVLDTIPIPLGDQQGNVKVKATVPLDLSKYETVDGAELSFSIRVREDRGQQSAPGQTSSDGSLLAQSNPANQNEQAKTQADSSTESPTSQQPANNELATVEAQNPPVGSTPRPPQDTVAEANTPAKASPGTRAAAAQSSANDGPKTASAPPSQANANSASAPAQQQSDSVSNAPEKMAKSDPKVDTPTEKSPTAEDSASENKVAQNAPSSKSPAPAKTSSPSDSENTNESQEPKASALNTAQNSSNQQSAQQQSAQQDRSPSEPGDSSPSPGNPLSKRGLDVEQAQSASSQRMRLKIDEWAGSYDGQQRIKLEIAIAPKLEALDRALEKAQLLSRSVLDAADAEQPWASEHGRDIQQADEQVEAAIKVVEDLEGETYDTPYAFIGLQLVDISQAHIGPARRDFWKSLQTKDDTRIAAIRDGWQHTVRARELLVLLTERFERTKLEYKMAASVEKLKKMYQLFVEDSMALLRQDGDGNRYSRKMAEFDLDEEYLARLQEVLNMRSEMRAELARILADDPRLLRRYLDAQRNSQMVLRNQLDRLLERQSELNRETRAWATVEENQRADLEKILLGRHVEGAQDLAIAASDLHDRFETWSPLGKEVEDADFQAASQVLQELATATRELSADGLAFVAASKRAKKIADDSDQGGNETESQDGVEGPDSTELESSIEEISTSAQLLYDRFTQLEVLLRRIGSRQDRPDIAYFATNRLLETRRLIEQTSAWIRQLKQQQKGNYHRSAEVAQYRLATETDTMAGKLANLEQQMAGLLQNQDGKLPQSIAEKARGLLAALDEQAAPNQLAAVYALRRNQLPRATSRQESAEKALQLAGKLYDDMVEESIKELDKLPVQDPIAGLLDDPTLDELLRRLEQELPLNELLGIPNRPSNLRIMSDWLQPGMDNGLMTGANRQMMLDQMRRQQQLRQRQLEQAYRRAVARALNETEAEDLVKDMPRLARETADWNRLASQLEDDLRQGRDKAPPERYRRAIEQYFKQVSGAKDGAKD